MAEPIAERLARIAAETLEKLAFVFSEPQKGMGSVLAADSASAQIQFSGSCSGTLVLTMSNPALSGLAANMLGLDDDADPTLDLKRDTLKEILNVICGKLLTELGGRTAVFQLQPPELLLDAATACMARPPTATTDLVFDEGGAQLRLFLDEPPDGDVGAVEPEAGTRRDP
jgi:CheY-specific phosphatase CheX